MIKIGNLFILLIVLGAMIGVNISQFRCAPCNRDYVFVDIFPQEELCCCQRVKTCPIQKTAVSSDEKCGAKKRMPVIIIRIVVILFTGFRIYFR